MSDENAEVVKTNFIRNIIDEDLSSDKNGPRVVTRFPPEPNGYLHIGHAKSICLNFGLAQIYNKDGVAAKCHLRFDDTNPEKEEVEYINSIQEDVKWLGFDWGENLYYASDYFDQMYKWAQDLINKGKAYICELSAEEAREYRGTLTEPGKNSPHRERAASESIALFEQMKNGEVEAGSMVLRLKIDMSSPNINLRDPIIYRIKKAHHPRTGDKWNIYPIYDFAHCLEDSIENVTHSICTLEFEDRRPLYDWILDTLELDSHPRQYEFSRLNLEYTIMSKRFLKQLVDEKHVLGWDDPRMPTVSGMRRRGYLAESIRNFCDQIGVTKKDGTITMSTLEGNVRDCLGPVTPRVLGVIDPLKVVITNWDKGTQEIECDYHPQDESYGKRMVPFTKEIYIEKEDFKEEANRKFFRLKTGGSVRLKFAYVITCDEVIKDDNGEIVELRCSYNEDTFAGVTPEGMKKVKGIINWVSATENQEIECRLYDRLFNVPNPLKDKDNFLETINPDSLKTVKSFVEKSIASSKVGDQFQFERQGYFIKDVDSTESNIVFNRTITLKDTWSKVEAANAQNS